MPTRARCWPRRSAGGWTPRSATGSSPRPAATRSRCCSCLAGLAGPSWRAGSGFPTRRRLPAASGPAFSRSFRRLPARPRRWFLPPPPGGAAGAGAGAAGGVRGGGSGAGGGLLGVAEAGPRDESQRARADLLRARLTFGANGGNDAPPLLLKAARRLEPIDAGLARGTYLDALTAALFAGRLARPGGSSRGVSEAARAAPRPSHPPRPPDLPLDGFAVYFTEGYAAATPILRRALSAFDRETSAEVELRWLWLGCVAASHLWDYDRGDRFSRRHLKLTREAGAFSELPGALGMRAHP